MAARETRVLRGRISSLAIVALAMGACPTALAQDGPTPPAAPAEATGAAERAWNPTVGFELKTTTHDLSGSGRTSSHSLMRYVLPKPDFTWTEAQKAIVDRWETLSVAERTKFFFENYTGGHKAANFITDSRKAPFLDGTVSWYESINIPHIEVRSKPFDSPSEALRAMKDFKADVRETIAFHTHYRFPYLSEKIQPRAAEVTDWMRRVSWSIWLNRARISEKSDFVLKAMDNSPVNVAELDKARKTFEGTGTGESKDIIERRGIRVSRLSSGEGPVLDIEFRGLMKDVSRIERYVEAADRAFRSGDFGPFSYGASSPYAAHESKDVLKFYTFGWHGKGSISPAELDYIGNQVEKLREANGIRSSLSPDELRSAVKRLATADSDAGKKMLMPTSWEWLFLPIDKDSALPKEVREQFEGKRKTYVEKLVKLSERLMAGEFGKPASGPLAESISSAAPYKADSVASRARRILLDFVKEPYRVNGRSMTLGEVYEVSVFEPARIAEMDRSYATRTGRREGFAGEREAARPGAAFDPAEPSKIFETLRALAIERAGERAAGESTPESRELARKGIESLAETRLEVQPESRLNIELDRVNNRVLVSEGLLGEIARRAEALPEAERAPFRSKVLGLMVGHELAHVSGLKAERVADAESIELLRRAPELARGPGGETSPLSEAELKAAVRTFTEAGTPFSNVLYRLKNLTHYGTVDGREANMMRALRGEVDPLASYRRADGTLRWTEVSRDGALKQGAGVAHFALALFLKELAVVVKTGDRSRIEEFFDGLMGTDFYVTYGLFSVGAQGANVAYSKYLQRFVKPAFVSNILRTNVVLATGMLLPELVHGTFDGKAFAISVGSLGLSSTAVRAGVSGLRWVVDLKRADQTGRVIKNLAAASRLARFGGWFYTAAETAVVLYVGDEIAAAVTKSLDDKAARGAVESATRALFAALANPGLDAGSLEAALNAFNAAHADYRNYLMRPVLELDALYSSRMEAIARDAKRLADEQEALGARLKKFPALAESITKQHGSVEAYLAKRAQDDEKALDARVDGLMADYQRAREAALAELQSDKGRRGDSYMSSEDALWVARGARAGDAGDPSSGALFFGGLVRSRAEGEVYNQARSISGNRAQAFEDERAALAIARRAVAGKPGLGAIIEARSAALKGLADQDRRLFTELRSDGLRGALEREANKP